MNWFAIIGLVIGCLALIVLIMPIMVFFFMKEAVPRMAEHDILFTTVKKGRIKALMIGGKIRKYVANISDQGKWVDPETGKINDGKEPAKKGLEAWIGNFLWEESGVVWLGFNGSVFKYMFNGTEASSLYLDNQIELAHEGLESTNRTQKTDIKIQVLLQATDAGRWCNLKDPFTALKNEILETVRGWAATNDADKMFAQETARKSSLYDAVMGLNTSSDDNPSIDETVGQKILNFSMMKVDWSPDVKEAMEREEFATKKKLADLQDVKKRAEEIELIAAAELQASKKKAEGIVAIGEAKNNALKGMEVVLGKDGATEVARSEAMASAISGFGGKALSLGGGGSPFIISDDSAEAGKAKATSKK